MPTTKPVSQCKPNPNQPRKDFSEAELRSLGASMLALGQLQPIGITPDGTILWGERRWRAAQLVGIHELSVIIIDRVLADTDSRLIHLAENIHRADLTGYEKWMACSNSSPLTRHGTRKTLPTISTSTRRR